MNSKNTLLDICEFIVDCEHKTAPTQHTGYPLIRTPNIGRGRFILDGVKRVSEETYKLWTQRAVPQTGDLILAREAPVGNVAIVPNNLKVCLGQRTVLIRPNKKIVDPNYLVYLLLGSEIQAKFHSLSNGATVHHLNMSEIRDLNIPKLPLLPIQQTIAGILSAYDNLIENNTRRIAILEEMTRVLYHEWFVKFRFPGHEQVKMVESELGMIPEGWKVANLGDIAHEIRRSVNPDLLDPKTPYFGLEHLPRRSIALLEWGNAQGVQSSKLSFKRNEILFGKIRPYLHKVGVAPLDGICSSDTIVILPRFEEYFALLLCCVSSDNFVSYASKTSQGTQMPRASWDVLARYRLVLPPSSLSIVSRFDEVIRIFIVSIHNWIFRNRNLRRTRDLLLPKIISGEIDISSWVENSTGEEVDKTAMLAALGVGKREMEKIEPIDPGSVIKHSLWE